MLVSFLDELEDYTIVNNAMFVKKVIKTEYHKLQKSQKQVTIS